MQYQIQLEITAFVIAVLAGFWEWGHKRVLERSKKIYRLLLILILISVPLHCVEIMLLKPKYPEAAVIVHIVEMLCKVCKVYLLYNYAVLLVRKFGKKRKKVFQLLPLECALGVVLLYIVLPQYRSVLDSVFFVVLAFYVLSPP